jgi:hypothetical protein
VQAERDVRVKRAQRGQITWGRVDLDAEVPVDHEVRAIAAVVDQLDLRGLYAEVRARGELAGAPATDPKILLGLWVSTRAGLRHFIPAAANDEALPAALAADPRLPPHRRRSHRPLAVPSGAANRAHALR